jgi:tetratricopeptide (TPR) repeat protein
MRRQILLFLSVALLLVNCNQNYPEGALIISDTDTTFNEDIRSVSQKIGKSPFVAENYYLRANAFFFQKNYENAIWDFNTALSLEPKNPLYRYRLAETFLEKDSANFEEASKQLKTAIQIKPDYAEAQYLYAKLLLARQQYDLCEPILITLSNNPDFGTKAQLLRVVSFKEQRDTLKAVAILDKVLIKDPNNYDATMQKAMFLLDKDIETASQYVDKALVIDEFSAEALYAKAYIQQQKSKYADAEILYNRVIKINPSHVFAHYNLAVIQAIFDNHDAVIDLCSKIIDLEPENFKAFTLRGYALEQKGNKKAARLDYQTALEIKPDYNQASEYLKELI